MFWSEMLVMMLEIKFSKVDVRFKLGNWGSENWKSCSWGLRMSATNLFVWLNWLINADIEGVFKALMRDASVLFG